MQMSSDIKTIIKKCRSEANKNNYNVSLSFQENSESYSQTCWRILLKIFSTVKKNKKKLEKWTWDLQKSVSDNLVFVGCHDSSLLWWQALVQKAREDGSGIQWLFGRIAASYTMNVLPSHVKRIRTNGDVQQLLTHTNM